MTGLVILTTGVWNTPMPTTMNLGSGDITYIAPDDRGVFAGGDAPTAIRVEDGAPVYSGDGNHFAWHDGDVEHFYLDEAQSLPVTGLLIAGNSNAVGDDGTTYDVLYGDAVETAAPLTSAAFSRGFGQFGMGGLGNLIVLISVLLFAISTSISWSYYGDRCANYLFGKKGILPFKGVFVLMHFVGAVTSLSAIWIMGDVALGLVTFPNLIALVLLSGVVAKLTKSYFERKPWIENAEVHRRLKEEKKQGGQ